MFIMENVGLKISELRKAKNMTQMELADRMSISFQAISNWERGNSMPDISKLPELAQLFDVSIDELLGEKSELIDSAANGKIDEYLENNEVTAQELSKVAPVLMPEQADMVFKSIKIHSINEVVDLLPFINREIVNQIARKAAESGNYDDMVEIAPFVDKVVMDEIAKIMIEDNKNIEDIAPFVSRSIIAELAEAEYHKNGLSALDDIAPFIPKEQLKKIAKDEYANRGLHHFESIAPFLDRAYLSDLAKKAIAKDGIRAISSIAPFFDKNMLSDMLKQGSEIPYVTEWSPEVDDQN